jgi:hypothetical protein
MLTEQRRTQLDNIVQQMSQNKEPDDNIQFVVDDFKKKYEHEAEQAQPQESGGILSTLTKIKNAPGQMALGALKSIGKTAISTAELGASGLDYLEGKLTGKTIDSTKILEPIKEKLQPTNTLQKIGGFAGEVAQYLTPIGAETAGVKATTIIGKLLSKSAISGAEFAGKTALMTGDRKQAKEAGIIGAVTPPVLKVSGKATKFAFGEVLPSVLSGMTGIAPDAIKAAFKNPIQVAEYMSKRVIPVDVREKAVVSLDKYARNVGDAFEAGLNALKKTNKTGVSDYPNIQLTKTVNDATKGIPSVFRRFAVGVKQDGLNFSKSAIVKAGEQKNLQEVYNTIKNQDDFSVLGIQRVAARINALSKFTEGAKEESSAIIGSIHSIYDDAIQKSFPGLGKIRAEYAADKQIISGIDNILKSAKDDITNPTVSTNVAKKLVNLFNEDNEAYVRALRRLEEATGDDLVNQFVAANFDKILPGKLGSYIGQAGLIAGSFVFNPLLLAVLPLFSPKLTGKVITTAGKAGGAVEAAAKLIPASVKGKTVPSLIISGK